MCHIHGLVIKANKTMFCLIVMLIAKTSEFSPQADEQC